MSDLFPVVLEAEIMDVVRKWWYLDKALPEPRKVIKCPQCQMGGVAHVRFWQFHAAPAGIRARVPYRCDVEFKCILCSMKWGHGVALDVDTYWRMTKDLPRHGRVPWRTGKAMLNGE